MIYFSIYIFLFKFIFETWSPWSLTDLRFTRWWKMIDCSFFTLPHPGKIVLGMCTNKHVPQFLQRLYHVSVTAWIMYQLVVFNVTTQILILSSSITWLGVIVCLLFKGCVPKDHTGTEAKIYVSLWTHLKGSELMAGGCRSTFHTCGRQWGQRSRTEHQAGEEAHSTLGVNSEDSIAASFLWRNKSL